MAALLVGGEFDQLLLSEQACSDRYGDEFSVLSFRLRREQSERTLSALAARLRETDVVGWDGEERVSLLLPCTDPEQARNLFVQLRSELPAGALHEPEPVSVHAPRALAPVRAPQRESNGTAREKAPEEPSISCEPAGVLRLLSRDLPPGKRAVDLLLSATGLLLLAPLLALIALAVKLTSPGPVLYRQERTGRNLRRFQILKFRTMREGSDRLVAQLQSQNEMSGPLFKMERDPRLTPIGHFLRHLSLDELPQLWNVLRGDMTLIGPRALSPRPEQFEPWQLPRFEVTPGLACEWQAEHRGETDFDEWMRSDLRYVTRGASFFGDLRLTLKTLLAVLTGRGGR